MLDQNVASDVYLPHYGTCDLRAILNFPPRQNVSSLYRVLETSVLSILAHKTHTFETQTMVLTVMKRDELILLACWICPI